MDPMTGFIVILGLLFIIMVIFNMVEEENRFRNSFKFKDCELHKWELVDKDGKVPVDAPLERKLNASMVCLNCKKGPQIYASENEEDI